MKVQVEWDGDNWVAVPESGGTTFARRLEQLPERVLEVVALMTGTTLDINDIELIVNHPGADAAAALNAERKRIDLGYHDLTMRTAATVLQLRDTGMSLRDIATLVGISHQRAHQIVNTSRLATSNPNS